MHKSRQYCFLCFFILFSKGIFSTLLQPGFFLSTELLLLIEKITSLFSIRHWEPVDHPKKRRCIMCDIHMVNVSRRACIKHTYVKIDPNTVTNTLGTVLQTQRFQECISIVKQTNKQTNKQLASWANW